MPALLSMSLSVLIWSLYPLAVTLGLDTMTSMQMIFVVYLFSGFGALFLGAHYLWQSGTLSHAIQIQKNLPRRAYFPIIISGLAGILCHTFFIIALGMADKGGVSLLYESWPIIAVVATPLMMRKRWKEVSLVEFVVSIIALIGVAIIILSDDSIDFGLNNSKILTAETDYTSLIGYILAFSGAYMCAILVVTKGVYAENFKEMNDDMGATIISEVFSRGISMILMLIAFFFFKEQLSFEAINWPATFYVGFVVFVVGGALYTYSLLRSDTPTLHIMYYFVPVFAVVWLWVANETTINFGLFIGGGIIVACNIYLYFAGRAAKYST